MPDVVLALDTATRATVVGLTGPGILEPVEQRHEAEPGRRPEHGRHLLLLAREALRQVDLRLADVERVVVGTGPGPAAAVRVGVVTGRAIALAAGAEIVGLSTFRALAEPAQSAVGPQAVVAPVLEARRGEVYVGGWRAGHNVLVPRAVTPDRAAELAREGGAWKRRVWLGIGDGAMRHRSTLEAAGVSVPADRSALHRVDVAVLCRLGAEAEPAERAAVLPAAVDEPLPTASAP